MSRKGFPTFSFKNVKVESKWLMGVLHWVRLVSNYGFFEGQEQCLQCGLGLVVVSRLVAMDWQNIKHV